MNDLILQTSAYYIAFFYFLGEFLKEERSFFRLLISTFFTIFWFGHATYSLYILLS